MYHRSIKENYLIELARRNDSRKLIRKLTRESNVLFPPRRWEHMEHRVNRGFLIKSGIRRSVSNGNMQVRPEKFCGRGPAFAFRKTGVRLDNDGIHPSISSRRDGWDGGVVYTTVEQLTRGRQWEQRWEKKIFFFFLYFLPLPWACIVIKKTRGELAIRSRARFNGMRDVRGEFFRESTLSAVDKYLMEILK